MAGWHPIAEGSLRLDGVTRSFRGRRVINGLSMSAPSGSSVAVVGPNGSGKTTLLRLIAGTLSLDAGDALVAGSPPGVGRTAFVPAGDRMLEWRLTGRQNLEFFAGVAGHRTAAIKEALAWVDDHLVLDGLLERRVGESSTGQRRRLMAAAAFMTGAPVILLDEPLEDLDATARRSLERATSTWCAAGGVVVSAAPEASRALPATSVLTLVNHGEGVWR